MGQKLQDLARDLEAQDDPTRRADDERLAVRSERDACRDIGTAAQVDLVQLAAGGNVPELDRSVVAGGESPLQTRKEVRGGRNKHRI